MNLRGQITYWREFRKSLGLTQQEFADSFGASYSHYTKLEGGFVSPSFELLVRLKRIYPAFDLNQLIKNP